jgi:hypothetical protein
LFIYHPRNSELIENLYRKLFTSILGNQNKFTFFTV